MKIVWWSVLACALTAQAQLPRRIQFGAALAEVPDSLRQAGAPLGALVTSVIEGSPAASAGVHAGDIIVRLAGDSVSSVANALSTLRPLTAGRNVAVTVVRRMRPTSLTFRTQERPRETSTTEDINAMHPGSSIVGSTR